MEPDLDWAMLVAYNRGKLDAAKGTPVYMKYASMSNGCDILIGCIANDRMFVVLDRFFNGEITDKALIHSLSALNLGRQYVALTERACRQITITGETLLSDDDRDKWKQLSTENRSRGIALADDICRRYRREGQFFDEIVKAGDLT